MDKSIGIGVSDFKKIIQNNIYYVDKTEFIKEVIDDKSEVLLITRPRRFGKTLNMNMLSYYFDIENKSNKKLFKGLKIMDAGEKYLKEMCSYPVINLSFVKLKENSYKNMILSIKNIIANIYEKYRYLLESDKISKEEKVKIKKILSAKENEVDLKDSIWNLTKYLQKYYNKKVILLIDEYDVPIQSAYVEGYYKEAVDFVRGMYTSCLKDKEYLEKAVVTRSIKNCKRKYI